MTQIVDRRISSPFAIGALADQGVLGIDTIYQTLLHKAFLFEYEISGDLSVIDTSEWFTGDGVDIALVQANLSAADLDTILKGAQITDQSMSVDVPSRQRVFAIADKPFNAFNPDTAGSGNYHWSLKFKPKARGGIPFTEGSGWKVVLINRTGNPITTGSFVDSSRVYQRFAYEGGGGA